MLLTFQKQFVEPIKAGTKIHTIREDKHNRWQVGKKIHFWAGNPRNVQSKPFDFGVGVVSAVHKIEVYPEKDLILVNGYPKLLSVFAVNDGFKNWQDMKAFFKSDFVGKLIVWKDCEWIGL